MTVPVDNKTKKDDTKYNWTKILKYIYPIIASTKKHSIESESYYKNFT